MDFLKWKIGFNNGIAVSSDGRRGGVACLWNNEVVVTLDRVVANESWGRLFPDAAVSVLVSSISDHLPLLLDTQKIVGWKRGEKSFKFENFWVDSPMCATIIDHSWDAGRDWEGNISLVQKNLSTWSKEEFGNLSNSIRLKQEQLKNMLCRPDWEDGEKVSEFILRPEGRWNDRMLRLWFSKTQADVIRAIPLSDGEVYDQLIWDLEAKGVYTVRSGYDIARQLLFASESVVVADTGDKWTQLKNTIELSLSSIMLLAED
ncbi:hypothetical protein ACFE04_011586 [Oxalis oulophora]